MLFFAFLLATTEPPASSNEPSATAPEASVEPSKFPIVREIDKIGGSGFTLVRFNVDEKGKAFDCTVVTPSGSNFLDEKACETIMNTAKFRPDRDKKGKPIATYGRTIRIRWNIEE